MTPGDLFHQVAGLEEQVRTLGEVARGAWDRTRALEALVLFWAKSQGTSRKDENLAHKKLLEEAEDIEKGQGIRWHNTTVHTRL